MTLLRRIRNLVVGDGENHCAECGEFVPFGPAGFRVSNVEVYCSKEHAAEHQSYQAM